LGVVVDQVFAHPQEFSAKALVLCSYMFAVQLYADFSGLTDIAIGTARLFGIRSPRNFDAPFYAQTIQDFWRRWHMTLTGWLSDYLFTPLRMGLREYGQIGLVLSIVINMVAVGVWHGATWTFVVFGLIHAGYMTVSSLTMRPRKRWWSQRPAWCFGPRRSRMRGSSRAPPRMRSSAPSEDTVGTEEGRLGCGISTGVPATRWSCSRPWGLWR